MSNIFSRVSLFKESRLRSLFSDFSSLEQINPEGFEANISAWEEVLLECLRIHTFNSSITLPTELLSSALVHPQFGEAKCLETVVKVLLKKRVFVSLGAYRDKNLSSSIFADIVSPFRLLQRFKNSLATSHSPYLYGQSSFDYLLHWPTLVTCADEIYIKLSEHVESVGGYSAQVLDFEMFSKFIKGVNANYSNSDIEALLIYLWKDGGLLNCQRCDDAQKGFTGCVVKVSRESIKATDLGILDLKVNIGKIESRVSALEKLVDEILPERIKQMLLLKKPKTRIQPILEQKAQLKKSLDSANATLNQLTLLLAKVDDVHQTEEVYVSLKSANAVLSSFNERISITDLDGLMADIETQMVISDEISKQISKPLNGEGMDGDSEEEMMKQLKTIESQEKLAAVQSKPGTEETSSDMCENMGQSIMISEGVDEGDIAISKLLSAKIENLSISTESREDEKLKEDIQPIFENIPA